MRVISSQFKGGFWTYYQKTRRDDSQLRDFNMHLDSLTCVAAMFNWSFSSKVAE